jgi:aspartate/methionine/tyrosine aminotransferase
MPMNPIAKELNTLISQANPHILDMLSNMGKALFFPKGILSQSAEAKVKAHRINATIGIAKQDGHVLALPAVTRYVPGIDPDDYLPYAPSFGLPGLREQWRKDLFEKNPSLAGCNISLPVVTSGITHGVSIFSDMWIDPGNVVILPDMMWGNYNMTFTVRNQAEIVHYKAYDDGLTRFNVDDFETVVRTQADINDKIITVLNFPHNPSGYSLTRQEAERVADILLDIARSGTHVVAVCDDAYFGLFFDEDTSKESLFARLAGKHERLVAVKLDGATKEDYVWGLRVGFITYGMAADPAAMDGLNQALEKKTAGCIRGNISNASHLGQTLLLKAMADRDYHPQKQEKFDLLKQRAARIKTVLADPVYRSGFDVYPFNSGYFMCIRLKDVDAEQLRCHLLDQYGVGLIAIGDRNIRVAFSCLEETDVKTLFDLILQGITDLRSA